MTSIGTLVGKCKSSFQILLKKNEQYAEVKLFLEALEKLSDDENLDCVPKKSKNNTPCAVERFLPDLKAKIGDSQLDKNLGDLSSFLNWNQIFAGDGVDEKLAKGLCAGQIIGKQGLRKSCKLFMGLFLLAPRICYPLHQHDTLEFYYVVSGSVDIKHGRQKKSFRVLPGQFSITPNNQVHSLTTSASPCLMSYIWIAGGGDLGSANWWWEEHTDGSWDRICWERQADTTWKATRRQKLSKKIILNSGDY